MKYLIALALMLFASPVLATTAQTLPVPWVKTTETYVIFGQVSVHPNNPVNLITGTKVGDPAPPRGPQVQNAWSSVDLKPYGVAADAKWAMLQGIQLITASQNHTLETATIQASFRAPGTAGVCSDYSNESAVSVPMQGIRDSTMAVVPLVNGAFEWCYKRSTGGTQPDHASYGINLSVVMWGR